MKIAIVAALLLALLVPATASAGTIAGKLPRKGKPASVRVVRAETAEVVAAKQGSRYRLKVPRGAYVVRGTAGKRAFSSRVVRVGRRTAKPKLRRARASAAAGPTLATVAVDPNIAITGSRATRAGSRSTACSSPSCSASTARTAAR